MDLIYNEIIKSYDLNNVYKDLIYYHRITSTELNRTRTVLKPHSNRTNFRIRIVF